MSPLTLFKEEVTQENGQHLREAEIVKLFYLNGLLHEESVISFRPKQCAVVFEMHY